MNFHYRWVIVAAGAFMGCVAIGSIFSLPVFLQPMSVATGWSRTAISLAMTLDFITMGHRQFRLGHGDGPVRSSYRSADWQLRPGPRPCAGKPRFQRDAILRIIQRDKSEDKRARAERLLERLDAA
jgi:hypothetical protein